MSAVEAIYGGGPRGRGFEMLERGITGVRVPRIFAVLQSRDFYHKCLQVTVIIGLGGFEFREINIFLVGYYEFGFLLSLYVFFLLYIGQIVSAIWNYVCDRIEVRVWGVPFLVIDVEFQQLRLNFLESLDPVILS